MIELTVVGLLTILFWNIIALCIRRALKKQKQSKSNIKSNLKTVSRNLESINVFMYAEGEWKGTKDGGIDPFNDLRQSYEDGIGDKQTMRLTKPKEMSDKDMDKNQKMKAKNMINIV